MVDIKKFTESVLSVQEITDLTGNKKIYFVYAPKPIIPYVTYQVIDENGEDWAENREIAASYYIQVDIFNKTSDYSILENKIREKMINAGFSRSMCADLYEKDTGLYHKAMRFIFTSIN